MRVTLDKVVAVMRQHGRLATLRTFPYQSGKRVVIKHPGGRLRGEVELVITDPKREDLERFLEISGFKSVEEWWDTAVKLHGANPRYLVVVRFPDGISGGRGCP